MTATAGDYRRFDVAPDWQRARYASPSNIVPSNKSPGVTLWGGDKALPPVGTRIQVTMNQLGPGTVRGYFVEYDWLGLLVELHNPPQWWIKQNGGSKRKLAHVFGIEFSYI